MQFDMFVKKLNFGSPIENILRAKKKQKFRNQTTKYGEIVTFKAGQSCTCLFTMRFFNVEKAPSPLPDFIILLLNERRFLFFSWTYFLYSCDK